MPAYWPIALVIVSNLLYHISARSTPDTLHPLASMTVVYTVGAVISLLLYFLLNRGENLLNEYRQVNWSSFALGLAVVGMEVGAIYMYKLGWDMSTGPLLYSSAITLLLVFIGGMFFHESITVRKLIGVAVCLVGLYFVNT